MYCLSARTDAGVMCVCVCVYTSPVLLQITSPVCDCTPFPSCQCAWQAGSWGSLLLQDISEAELHTFSNNVRLSNSVCTIHCALAWNYPACVCLCVKGKIWGLAQYCTTVSIKYAHCTTFQHLHPTQQHTCCHTHTDTHSRSEKLGFTRTNMTDVERRIRQGGKMEGEAARETGKGINRKCCEAWECYKYVPS